MCYCIIKNYLNFNDYVYSFPDVTAKDDGICCLVSCTLCGLNRVQRYPLAFRQAYNMAYTPKQASVIENAHFNRKKA